MEVEGYLTATNRLRLGLYTECDSGQISISLGLAVYKSS